jgi:hypothetical protein
MIERDDARGPDTVTVIRIWSFEFVCDLVLDAWSFWSQITPYYTGPR